MLRRSSTSVSDKQRRFPVAAIGTKDCRTRARREYLFFENALDTQHLLHLVTDRQFVLEDQRHVVAEMHRALFLVRNHLGAECLARLGIRFERHQAIGGDLRHTRDYSSHYISQCSSVIGPVLNNASFNS